MSLLDGAFTSQGLIQALDVLAKLVIAAVLGGLIGWQREVHGRPAGMRTHILLVVGVVLMCEVSKVFGGDSGRIAAQIVTGVGFIGAGAILRMGLEVKGLTSAASLWAATGIAMAVSVGGPLLIVAVLATGLAFFTLDVLQRVEKWALSKTHPRQMSVTATGRGSVESILRNLEASAVAVHAVEIVKDQPNLEALFELSGNADLALRQVLATEGVSEAHWLDS